MQIEQLRWSAEYDWKGHYKFDRRTKPYLNKVNLISKYIFAGHAYDYILRLHALSGGYGTLKGPAPPVGNAIKAPVPSVNNKAPKTITDFFK